jgi:hypothetical protein
MQNSFLDAHKGIFEEVFLYPPPHFIHPHSGSVQQVIASAAKPARQPLGMLRFRGMPSHLG